MGAVDLSSLAALESPFERLPPQSMEAEQALLGGLLVDTSALHNVIETVKPGDFYRPAHQHIFEAVIDLFEKHEPVDIITVSEQLARGEHLEEAGGRAYINDLALAVTTTENIPYYSRLVREKSILRQLIQAGTDIVGASYEAESADAALDEAQQAIFQLAQKGEKDFLTPIHDILPTTYEQIEDRYANKGSLMGAATGFYDMDTMTSGLQKSDLIILAARPSMGKTAFALNILSHVALREQKPVLVFSLEMSKEQLVQRILCAEAEIDAQRIRTGEINEHDFQKISMAMGKLGDAPIYIDDSPGLTPMELRTKARKIMMETGELGLIVIDYLQLMEGRAGGMGDNRVQEISGISRGLKGIARELNVPVLSLSQLSRAVESRQDKRPMLSDLRESGSIEQDADMVMFIYRDEYYNSDSERPGIADIIIAKQRNGPVGSFELLFRNNITRFLNPREANTRIY